MQLIYANQVVSVSELKKNPTKIIKHAEGNPVAILNHNVATAYLIPAKTFEKILDSLDEQLLKSIVQKRLKDNKKSIKVNLNDL